MAVASDPRKVIGSTTAVLTLENRTFTTVFDVSCAQSYLLSLESFG